jgi:hypothetical protein
VHLSPPPLPRPLFTKSILHTLSSSPVGPSASNTNNRSNNHRPTRSAPQAKASSQAHEDDGLTDADADGDPDQETQPFTSNHPFFQSQRDTSPSPCKKRRREDPVILVEDSDAEDSEEDTTEENLEIQPDPSRWNEPRHAFALYLLQFMDPLGFPYDGIDESFFEEDKVYDPFEDDDSDSEVAAEIQAPVRKEQERDKEEQEEDYEEYEDDQQEEEEAEADIDLAASEKEDEEGEDDEAEYDDDDGDDAHQYTLGSTPGLTHCDSSSSPRAPHLSPSLFPFAASSLPDPSDLSIILEAHYPNKKYAHTPAPPKARKHRLRLSRVEKRFAKIKKAEFLCKYDEVEEEPAVVEVDELEDEGEDEKWTMPVLKEGEVWDPFGDEEEI